jgi:hypothetical protein
VHFRLAGIRRCRVDVEVVAKEVVRVELELQRAETPERRRRERLLQTREVAIRFEGQVDAVEARFMFCRAKPTASTTCPTVRGSSTIPGAPPLKNVEARRE